MSLSNFEKQRLINSVSDDKLAHRYQQFIDYIYKGAKTGIIDDMEYKIHKTNTLKNDIQVISHCLLTNLITFEEYWDKMQMLVAWDLMIQGIMNGQIKAKSNGEEKHDSSIV